MVNDVTMIEAGPMPDYREIDLASEQGLALLRSAADRYGETIVQAAGIASRLFLLRSPWAPGLRFVGGQTKPEGSDDDGNPFETLSLSGTGETLEEALVSCIGEGIERLAQFERSGDVRARAALPELRDRVMPSLVPLIERQLANTPTGDAALEWIDGYMLEPGGEKHVGSPVLLPADWSLRRSPTRVRLRPPTMLGTGVAAGPDWDWAASRALLELVERDAAGLWWIGGCRGRPVALDDPSLPAIVRLLGTLRQDAKARHTWLLDITTDIGLPVIAALSCSGDGRGVACGLASRTSLVAAARAAVLELCQMELAILLAQARLAERGEASLTVADRQCLARATKLDANCCELLHPLGAPGLYDEPTDQSQLPAIARVLMQAGVEAALVDLTRPQNGIQVVRAVAPALQPLPSDIVTPRLRLAIADTGGGARHTGGIPLL